jgi:indolepyruvate ferredoxin oxidoreductase alpha subunit
MTSGETRQQKIAVIGDSTFFHTGLPALLNVAYNRSDTVTVILDNRTTAMTGHQQHPATGRTLRGEPAPAVNLEELVRAMGFTEVHVVDPYDMAAVERVLRHCTALEGPAVVIAQRECALLPVARQRYLSLRVRAEVCEACGVCLTLGCPAMSRSETLAVGGSRRIAQIDPLLCTGCELCAQLCPHEAITRRSEIEAERAQTH